MSQKSILVVDDNELVRSVVTKAAEGTGVTVTCAEDGALAKKLLAEAEHYDAIFLDLLMPNVSGWEVLESIRDNPATENTPVYILSGAPISEGEQAKLAERATAFIDKRAFDLDTLERILLSLPDQ